jgi:hypothetical protein
MTSSAVHTGFSTEKPNDVCVHNHNDDHSDVEGGKTRPSTPMMRAQSTGVQMRSARTCTADSKYHTGICFTVEVYVNQFENCTGSCNQ